MIARFKRLVAFVAFLLAGPPTCALCNRPMVFADDIAKGECWRHEFLRLYRKSVRS